MIVTSDLERGACELRVRFELFALSVLIRSRAELMIERFIGNFASGFSR